MTNETTNEFSVTRTEYKDQQPAIYMLMPYGFGEGNKDLPPMALPQYEYWGYYRPRDVVLINTPQFDPEGWGTAVNKATSKMGAMSWYVDSPVPLRANRMKDMLMRAGVGMGQGGWVKFIQAATFSYINVGLTFIEKERDNLGRLVNLHLLNPLRCRLRNDYEYPVAFMRYDGTEVNLSRNQVTVLSDTMNPTQGEYGLVSSAAERAYSVINRMASANWYVIQKIRGERPLAINFVQGLTNQQVNDAIISSTQDAERKKITSYMGASIVPVPQDTTLSLVTVPLAELPDKFNILEERQRADLVYANSIGLDPQDLNPALLASGSLGTGTQARVLQQAASGNSLASFRKQFTHFILELDEKCEFSFEEFDAGDELAKEDIKDKRATRLQKYITAGMITTQQALNVAVDEGDLPEAFLAVDLTDQESIGDAENAQVDAPPNATAEPPVLVQEDEDEEGEDDDEEETAKAEDSPFFVTKTIAEDAIETPQAERMHRTMARLLERQAREVNVRRVLSDIPRPSFQDVTQDQLEQLLTGNIPPIDPTEDEERELLLLLLFFAQYGAREEMTERDSGIKPQFNSEVSVQAAQRMGVLISGMTFPSDYPLGTIGNPNLPEEGGLDRSTAYFLSLILLGILHSEGAADMTYVELQKEYEKETKRYADERGKLITDTEAARATAVGLFLLALLKGGKTKTWLRTESKNPRDSHLAMVGMTIGFDDYFPDGSFWSNELPYCKCGIRVGYRVLG
jgi:hypothetical protein